MQILELKKQNKVKNQRVVKAEVRRLVMVVNPMVKEESQMAKVVNQMVKEVGPMVKVVNPTVRAAGPMVKMEDPTVSKATNRVNKMAASPTVKATDPMGKLENPMGKAENQLVKMADLTDQWEMAISLALEVPKTEMKEDDPLANLMVREVDPVVSKVDDLMDKEESPMVSNRVVSPTAQGETAIKEALESSPFSQVQMKAAKILKTQESPTTLSAIDAFNGRMRSCSHKSLSEGVG